MSSPIDAIVLGLSPTGLYAARELHRAGCRVLGVDASHACAQHSNTLQEHWRIADQSQLLASLLALGNGGTHPTILLPTSDAYIEFVVRHASVLRTRFRFASCYHGIGDALLDKQRFHALCQSHGMLTPRVWQVQDNAELDSVIDQIGFPCILKPALIHRARECLRGHKVVLAKTRDALLRSFEELADDVGGWLIQEVIPGPESNITLFGAYVNRGGEAVQAFTARKLRQYPPGFGSASLAVSETCAETAQLSMDFLRTIGFHGVCGTEFKRDPRDGLLKIIEINPRPTLWFQLSHAAGKRIVESAWRDLTGKTAPGDSPQHDGVRWRYALKDMASARFYHRHGRDFIFPAPDISAADSGGGKAWAVFDWNDPLPALAEPLVYLRKRLRGQR